MCNTVANSLAECSVKMLLLMTKSDCRSAVSASMVLHSIVERVRDMKDWTLRIAISVTGYL
jgi:hypothetical protein